MTFQKQTTPQSEAYKAWIRALPCLVCLMNRPTMIHEWHSSDPHHVPAVGHAAKGMKASDYRVIPLCGKHHREYHSRGRKTFATTHDIDYEYVIQRLNTIYEEAYGNSAL